MTAVNDNLVNPVLLFDNEYWGGPETFEWDENAYFEELLYLLGDGLLGGLAATNRLHHQWPVTLGFMWFVTPLVQPILKSSSVNMYLYFSNSAFPDARSSSETELNWSTETRV